MDYNSIRIEFSKFNYYGKIFWGSFVFLIFISIFFILVIIPVWNNNKILRNEVAAIQKDIDILENKKKEYENKIEAINNDPFYVEFLLRTKLYYGRSGEFVSDFPD
mgnify:FL=1